MRRVYGLEKLDGPCGPAVMTIGNFDGVHVGHRRIVQEAVSLAGERKLTSVVMTFELHPARVLMPDCLPEILTPTEVKADEIEKLGVDVFVVIRCDESLLSLEPDEFIENILLKHFQMKAIVEGPNFHFGRNRVGNIDLLMELGPKMGFEAIKVQPVELDLDGMGPTMISSSLIRELLKDGDVHLAAECLGRCYELTGNVVPGHGRGRSLGFPTANVETGQQMVPSPGVYAALVEIDDRQLPCAVHIGSAATFGTTSRAVEAHVLDFNGDLYGRALVVKLIARVRDTVRFDDAASLVEQMQRDIQQVRQIIADQEGRH